MAGRPVVTEFKWTLYNFKRRFLTAAGTLNSEIFSLNGGSTAKFQVQVLSNCHIHLVCRNFGQEDKIKLNAQFSIEYDGKKFEEPIQSYVFKKAGNVVQSGDFLSNDLYHILKYRQMQGGSAIVCFKIQQEVPIHEVSDEESEVDIAETFEKLSLSLHGDGTLITIKAEEKETKILKGFLVHHSEVFKEILSVPNSIEAQSRIITVDNVSATVIEAMRNWMYAMEIENFDEIAPALFKIAQKYKIVKLKEKCVRSMGDGLTWKNVPYRLILAQKYSEDLLKQRALEFIRYDRGNINFLLHILMKDWLKLCDDDPELEKEIKDLIYSKQS